MEVWSRLVVGWLLCPLLGCNFTTESLLDTNLSTSQPQGCSFFFNRIFIIGVSWRISTWALDLIISLHLPHIDGLRSSNLLIWTLWFPTCYRPVSPVQTSSLVDWPHTCPRATMQAEGQTTRLLVSSQGQFVWLAESSKGEKVPICVLYHSSQHPKAGFGTVNFLINPRPHIQSDVSTTSCFFL